MDSARALGDAAARLVDSLDDDQRARACLPFEDEGERRTWFYWPGDRGGVTFADLSASQRLLAFAALSTALSLQAYAKATTIISLEEVLDRLEGGQGSRRGLRRDSAAYATTVFGDPTSDGPWGWRFEGHHVSVHATVAGDEIAAVPLFLGSNPARVDHHGRTVVRPLAEEEDVARALLGSLTAAQRSEAIVGPDAPDDILTTNAPRVEPLPEEGVAVGALRGESSELARTLVDLYVDRLPDDVAAPVVARLDGGARDDIRFSWRGDVEVGGRHYYRLQGPRFLVEYDNTQNDANHVHTVWRDPDGDFGDDLLRRHLHDAH